MLELITSALQVRGLGNRTAMTQCGLQGKRCGITFCLDCDEKGHDCDKHDMTAPRI